MYLQLVLDDLVLLIVVIVGLCARDRSGPGVSAFRGKLEDTHNINGPMYAFKPKQINKQMLTGAHSWTALQDLKRRTKKGRTPPPQPDRQPRLPSRHPPPSWRPLPPWPPPSASSLPQCACQTSPANVREKCPYKLGCCDKGRHKIAVYVCMYMYYIYIYISVRCQCS